MGNQVEELRQAFKEQYAPAEPTYIVEAPGRINLIGDHIDYNGLPVFPMALNRRVTMLFRTTTDKRIRVFNADARYPPLEFTISSSIEHYADGEWGNYVKAAVQELLAHFLELRGIDAVIQSDIPVAAGLSSSSALLVATAVALIEASGMAMERRKLMELLARAERYVGTEGGGMDQAICLGAKEGTATRIKFDPIRLKTAAVPDDWRFVVANSMVEAKKSGAARDAYNKRTRECREAFTSVIGELALMDEVDSYSQLLARVPVEEILVAAQVALPETLGRRFMHVVSEAVRVLRAERAMRESDAETFGRVMSESHRSLRDDFEVSGPELNELTAITTGAGAKGARLTGAGFGGCVIALCTTATVSGVRRALEKQYYSGRKLTGDLKDLLFVARPGGGATVRELPTSEIQHPSA
jgi:galactokinase